ncbi:MAG: hypothetical protein U5K74_07940 [Gemmatimonadaceae bacterium]|nr:hypothetical protein [Gemmatimonadaceae bacterium]
MDATNCERSFLAALDGGCQVPIGALMTESEGGRRMLHGLVAGLDGTPMLRREMVSVPDVTGQRRSWRRSCGEQGAAAFSRLAAPATRRGCDRHDATRTTMPAADQGRP